MRAAADMPCAGAQIDGVEISRKNFVLAEAEVQPDRRESLAYLAARLRSLPTICSLASCCVIVLPPSTMLPAAQFACVARAIPHDQSPVAKEAPILDAENGLNERVGKIPPLDGVTQRPNPSQRLPVRRFHQHRWTIDAHPLLQGHVIQRPKHRRGESQARKHSAT